MAKAHGIVYSTAKSPQHPRLCGAYQGMDLGKHGNGHLSPTRFKFSGKQLWGLCNKLNSYLLARESPWVCWSTETEDTETEECLRCYEGCSDMRDHGQGKDCVLHERGLHSTQGLAEACKFVYNDAKYVNERARNDIVMLSRGILRMDARARQDLALLGSGLLKIDARAREDTQKIDQDVKTRAEHLNKVAIILKSKAESRLKSVADRHWSDGGLEADLRRADLLAKQRATEDALMALEFIKDIHNMMMSKMYELNKDSLSADDMAGGITLEKNGKALDFFPGEVSTDRITAIQEAYWNIASTMSDADGIDYTDPEELEYLVATLIDLDAMDGKGSVTLLAECSSSPDVETRKALANALAAAPSMWTLGNAGMGALQRLAEDSNPAIAAAASRTIYELKRQWEIEEGDSWRFMMNQAPMLEVDSKTPDDDDDDDDTAKN